MPLMHAEMNGPQQGSLMAKVTEEHPDYLYKILEIDYWNSSQGHENLILSSDDKTFIHFSKADQLERILDKYWSNCPQFVVLKIDVNKLKGHLIFETNPGGSAKYYHLYQGAIPMSSIIEFKPFFH